MGQLGAGYTNERELAPVAAQISGVAEVSTFVCHTCALASAGGVACWGTSFSGELGPATTGDSSTPVAIPGLESAVSVSAGVELTCAALADGTARCFGNNMSGQLGGGSLGGTSADPVTVLGISDATSVFAGGSHVCAFRLGGTVSCWGANSCRQLGDGSTHSSIVPVDVDFPGVAVQVTAGDNHSCLLDDTGTVFCWGANSRGQLGDGTSVDASSPVMTLVELTDVVAIEAGDKHTCVATAAGEAYCWGFNEEGQLGDGSQLDRSTPVPVTGLSNVLGVSTASKHTCAWLADYTAHCWGSSNGASDDRSLVPVRVIGL